MARILVVDDSIENLTLIELFLRDTEFEVTTAGGGREALELAAEERYDLILLDVVMPGIDGFEVCRRLKDDPQTAFVPVIFLTGRLADESEKLAAYQLGAVDYIQKPVNRDELVARIRVMLRLVQARSRLDRENVVLRRQVESLSWKLQETTKEIEELQTLRAAFAASREPGIVLLDALRRVLTIDKDAAALLGGVAVGATLASGGHAPARVARLVEDGVHTADLMLPVDDGSARVVHVVIRKQPAGGGTAVLLHDVTAVSAAEKRVQDREQAELAPSHEVREFQSYAMTDFVGSSERVAELADVVDRLRQSRSTVMIHGESGTGKELVARALHFDGVHRNAPFIPLHCGAIAPELVESELFGHEKGAFTGAQQSRDGLFRAADGGTIFLDEIAEMSMAVQIKLLRVLQRGEIRPVGANQPRIVDVRIIAATNQQLIELVRDGRFREDLYYRLQVVQLDLPALRERIDDLPSLIDHFVSRGNTRHGRSEKPVRGVSRGALDHMLAYPWPGNVRELEHTIERAFAMGCGELLQEEDLPENIVLGRSALDLVEPVSAHAEEFEELAQVAARGGDDPVPDFRALRRRSERQAIVQAMLQTAGDKIAAASLLGMSRSTFYRRLKAFGL